MDSEEEATPASSNRTLVITLSTVLSTVALLLVIATAIACFRVKHGRLPFIIRGITPIDDEEIESWKRRAGDEKYTASPATQPSSDQSSPRSLRKAPSVIVYHTPAYSSGPEDAGSVHSHHTGRPRSRTYPHSPSYAHAHTLSGGSTKHSVDLPPAAVLARAPNSRPGLTDETVEGDDAFIPTQHRRQGSRLSKKHSRSRSSASYQWGVGPTSPRQSGEQVLRTSYSFERSWDREREGRGHARIYSDPSVPPRLSFDGQLRLASPPLVKDLPTPESEIGRAIG
ncbi:hypothetical protein VUR80DRAFT_5257 [Thermomyces stellatus]